MRSACHSQSSKNCSTRRLSSSRCSQGRMTPGPRQSCHHSSRLDGTIQLHSPSPHVDYMFDIVGRSLPGRLVTAVEASLSHIASISSSWTPSTGLISLVTISTALPRSSRLCSTRTVVILAPTDNVDTDERESCHRDLAYKLTTHDLFRQVGTLRAHWNRSRCCWKEPRRDQSREDDHPCQFNECLRHDDRWSQLVARWQREC